MLTKDELSKLNRKELIEELGKNTIELLRHRLSVVTRQSKETARLKGLRKYTARIKTFKRKLESK